MTKQEEKISIRAYADHLGISDKAIRNAIRDGKIKKGVAYRTETRKGIDVEVPEVIKSIADKEYGDLHKTDKVKPGQNKAKIIEKPEAVLPEKKSKISPHLKGADRSYDDDDFELTDDEDAISRMKITKDMSFGEATRRRELIGLALDKKKLQEMEGSLVRKVDVEKALFALGVELKKGLLNIPARVTAEVRSSPSDVDAQRIMTVEITNILNEFSNLQELKL